MFSRSLYIKYFIRNIDQEQLKQLKKQRNDPYAIEFDEVNNQVVELGFEDAPMADGFAADYNFQQEQKPINMF